MTGGWQGDPTEPAPGYGGGYGNQAGEPTRAMPPPNRRPGSGGPYYDDQQRRRRRLWLIAAGILAALIIIVLIVLLITSSGSSSNGVNISSFNAPNTVPCSGPTTIGLSWSTSNANQITLSIDGSLFKTYPGGSGADTVPFACNGLPHRYTLTARNSNGTQTTQTQTVTPVSTTTTTQKPTPTTQPPPPSTTSPPPPTATTTTS
jgi:hypothetical protein